MIGGGLPVGAYGGRRDLMEQIAPSGPVYQAGTLSGSPPAMAAGVAVLDVLREEPALYERLERLGDAPRRPASRRRPRRPGSPARSAGSAAW